MIVLSITICIISIILFIILFSSIEIAAKDFELSVQNNKIENRVKLYVKLKFLNKITIFKTNLSKKAVDSKQLLEQLDKVKRRLPINKKSLKIENISLLKKLNIQLKNVKLNVLIGIEDASINAIIVGLISGAIGTTIGLFSKEKNSYIWKVTPIYKKNVLTINLDCIIIVKMIHIIYTIYLLVKKGDKGGGTSNRRAYAYSNE